MRKNKKKTEGNKNFSKLIKHKVGKNFNKTFF